MEYYYENWSKSQIQPHPYSFSIWSTILGHVCVSRYLWDDGISSWLKFLIRPLDWRQAHCHHRDTHFHIYYKHNIQL